MLITLVIIEQNCTFNLEASRLCVRSSPHRHHLAYIYAWCALTQNQAL